jgi:hypothetical protein
MFRKRNRSLSGRYVSKTEQMIVGAGASAPADAQTTARGVDAYVMGKSALPAPVS